MVNPQYLFDSLLHLGQYLREHSEWHLDGGRMEAGAAFDLAARIVQRAIFRHPLDDCEVMSDWMKRDRPSWLVEPITVNDVLEWERKLMEEELNEPVA